MDESSFVERLRTIAPGGRDVSIGIGDDSGAWQASSVNLITTDTLVEGVHYRMDWSEPADIGWKSVMVSLSDIAAMGGTPRYLLVNLVAPDRKTEPFIDGYLEGLDEALSSLDSLPNKLALIGGDTAVAPTTMVTSTVMGESPHRGPVTRSTAEPGDYIFVSGPMGDSRAGLERFEMGEVELGEFEALEQSYLRPVARVELGRRLGKKSEVTSLIDTSDGLGRDLTRICAASGVGARINLSRIPRTEDLTDFCHKLRRDINSYLVNGGEEFELLGTLSCTPRDLSVGISEKLHIIGRVTSQKGVVWEDEHGADLDIDIAGYDHFEANE